MPLDTLLNQPCVILRRSESTEENEFHDEVPEVTPVDAVCELQQISRTERDAQGEVSDTRWLLVLPVGTIINTGDSVMVEDQEYEMTGDPWPVRNPRTGAESHVECTLRRTAGSEDTGS